MRNQFRQASGKLPSQLEQKVTENSNTEWHPSDELREWYGWYKNYGIDIAELKKKEGEK